MCYHYTNVNCEKFWNIRGTSGKPHLTLLTAMPLDTTASVVAEAAPGVAPPTTQWGAYYSHAGRSSRSLVGRLMCYHTNHDVDHGKFM